MRIEAKKVEQKRKYFISIVKLYNVKKNLGKILKCINCHCFIFISVTFIFILLRNSCEGKTLATYHYTSYGDTCIELKMWTR